MKKIQSPRTSREKKKLNLDMGLAQRQDEICHLCAICAVTPGVPDAELVVLTVL